MLSAWFPGIEVIRLDLPLASGKHSVLNSTKNI
jgi:hypothetical protein